MIPTSLLPPPTDDFDGVGLTVDKPGLRDNGDIGGRGGLGDGGDSGGCNKIGGVSVGEFEEGVRGGLGEGSNCGLDGGGDKRDRKDD